MERLGKDSLELVNEFLGEPDLLEDHSGSTLAELRYKQAWRDVWAWLGCSRKLLAHYVQCWIGYFGTPVCVGRFICAWPLRLSVH